MWRTARNGIGDYLAVFNHDTTPDPNLPEPRERLPAVAAALGAMGTSFLAVCRDDLRPHTRASVLALILGVPAGPADRVLSSAPVYPAIIVDPINVKIRAPRPDLRHQAAPVGE